MEIDYNQINENKLLILMEKQGMLALKQKDKAKQNMKGSLISIGLSAITIATNIIFASLNPMLIFRLFAGISTINLILGFWNLTSNYQKNKELKKIDLFLNERAKLNSDIGTNPNMTLGLSEVKKKKIKSTSLAKEVFNINSIDQFSYNDLKTIKSNYERIRDFDFCISEEMEITPKRILKKEDF